MERHVFSYIEANRMIVPGDWVYVAVSGGADSVCLLLLLLAYRERTPFELRAVHIEHGIRGEASLADAAFVEELCRAKGISLELCHVDAPAYARERGLSLEEAARELRYAVFAELTEHAQGEAEDSEQAEAPEEVRQKEADREDVNQIRVGQEEANQGEEDQGEEYQIETSFEKASREPPCVKIALAHHSEDQAETILFNLARGAGLRGIAGMRPVRGQYIRPMLETQRGQIEAYLIQRGQGWREDATNEDVHYARNLIRRQILPVLTESVNAQTVRHLCEAARRAAEAADHLEGQAADFCREHMRVSDKVILDIIPLRQERTIMREYILRRAVYAARGGMGLKDVGEIHIHDLAELVDKPRGKRLDLPGRLKAARVDRSLVLYVENGPQERPDRLC